MAAIEFNDVYDKNRNLTGKVHRRDARWRVGEYGLVVCTWVYDGKGNILLTRRAPDKSFAGTWENTGGAVLAGETSRQAIVRELFEETGIRAEEDEFELLSTNRTRNLHFDFYCIRKTTPLDQIVLLPGETDDVRWASIEQIDEMVKSGEICRIIGRQFQKHRAELVKRQSAQE